MRTAHLAEILAATMTDTASPPRRSASSRTPSCGRTSRNATDTIRAKRARVVAELPDWEELREAGRAIKADVHGAPRRATSCSSRPRSRRAGGQVHWARDAAEANAIVAAVARGHGADEVVKVKSLTTDEIGLNDGARRGTASTRSRPTSPS